MKFAVVVLFCSLASAPFAHATETTIVLTSTQDRDTQLQTHLSRVPDVDAQNYYNKNVNQAFRLFRPDLETDDEKLKEKYGVEFLPTLTAKQSLSNLKYTVVERTESRHKRDAGAIRFGDSPPLSRYGGTSSKGQAQSQSQSITASLHFGPFGASITSANSASNAHANSGFNGYGGSGSGAVAQAAADSGSFGGGHHYGGGGSHASAQASANAIGLVPPPLHGGGHYGGYPNPGHGGYSGNYPSNYGYGGYYQGGGHGHYGGGHFEQGHYGYQQGYGHNPYGGGHYSAGQYGHFEQHGGGHHFPPKYPLHHYPGGGLYGGEPAGHYPDSYDGYGRSGKISRTGLKEKL